MIENFLLQIGMRCGSVKNFNTTIIENLRSKDFQKWYFLTPVKSSDKGTGLKEATIQMAFPFEVERGDISEQAVIERLTPLLPDYEAELLKALRRMVIVPSYTLSLIPFWANEKGERVERKDFASARIHIINASVTIRYRETWFNCNC